MTGHHGQADNKVKRRPAVRFSRKIFEEICEHISNNKRVTEVCNMDGMPSVPTLFRWLAESDIAKEGSPYFGLSKMYSRAMLCRAQHIEDEILDIVDDSRRDTTTRTTRTGEEYEVPDHEWIGRSKLRFEARRWLLGKLAPIKYGDPTTVAKATAKDGDGNTLEIVVTSTPGF